MWKDGVDVEGSYNEVTKTPELAHYSKDGKVLNAF